MEQFDKFACCPKHCKASDYLLEHKLCGENGRDLCPRMPRVLQMKNTELIREVLGFVPLPPGLIVVVEYFSNLMNVSAYWIMGQFQRIGMILKNNDD